MIPLLTLIIGVAIGWYAKWVYETLNVLKENYQDRKVDREAGVVRPVIRKGIPVRAQQQALEATEETGGVRPPTPREMAQQHKKEAAEALKRSMEAVRLK